MRNSTMSWISSSVYFISPVTELCLNGSRVPEYVKLICEAFVNEKLHCNVSMNHDGADKISTSGRVSAG